MGPHGICIGATGSGKSEMLRTLITALALSHPPEDLSMVLVDYKGGAAFAPFSGLPHVAGIIDNLADDPQLTERARASIDGEVVRRQELLRDAGSAVDQPLPRAATASGRSCRRCRTCSSSSTSSASCSPPSRTSSTCCSPSAGSAGPSACTCCCPASGSSPASSAAWTPTCRTGSACAPSPRRRARSCWTPRTPSTCRPCPATATSRSTPRSTAASAPATSPGR